MMNNDWISVLEIEDDTQIWSGTVVRVFTEELNKDNLEGNIIPGELKKVRTPKTVYDPRLISDKKMLQWGEEAMKNGKIEGRKITGTSKNGLKFEGYIDEATGEITNFFPTLR
ncbi:CdiA family toxin C-terminal domain-containing protein [Bacillus altitudinis]|uniref:CdiA family toxin C-terminal domain-containing protein n=1 Tax=Bacillus altitudinis TaxID=293387 RepID=UPI0037C8199C